MSDRLVLGIDPGTRVIGWALVWQSIAPLEDSERSNFHHETIGAGEFAPPYPAKATFVYIRPLMRDFLRSLMDWAVQTAATRGLGVRLAVESPMGRLSMGTRSLWAVQTMAEEAAVAAGMEFEVVTPNQWRQLAAFEARESGWTFNQKALKELSAQLAREALQAKDLSQDGADAWWIARFALCREGGLKLGSPRKARPKKKSGARARPRRSNVIAFRQHKLSGLGL